MKIKVVVLHIALLLGVVFLIHCSSIGPNDPTGFGVWDNNCGGIAVAVNQSDWDSGLFMNHPTNERYDLHLCDTSGKIIRTLFTSRQVDGNFSSIDSMDYDINQGYIVIYSVLYGTGKVKREKILLDNTTISESELIDNNKMRINYDVKHCFNSTITWDYPNKWIKISKK